MISFYIFQLSCNSLLQLSITQANKAVNSWFQPWAYEENGVAPTSVKHMLKILAIF